MKSFFRHIMGSDTEAVHIFRSHISHFMKTFKRGKHFNFIYE